jgi:hypothetical protein
MIKKEYRCLAHGFFEADSPVCPYGCDTAIERAFLTAPGLASTRTRNIDRTLTQLALDFGMTDMTNRRGNGSVGDGQPRPLSGNWQSLPRGEAAVTNAINAQGIPAANQALAQYVAARQLTPPGDMQTQGLPRPVPIVDPRHHFGGPADLARAVEQAK